MSSEAREDAAAPGELGAAMSSTELKTDEVLSTVQRGGKRRVIVGLIVIMAIAAAVWFATREEDKTPQFVFETASAARGDIAITVTATGRLEPQRSIQIGAEVSGKLTTVEVEVNQRVKKGQVLARFDTERLDSALDQAEAQRLSSAASTTSARATLLEAERSYERVKKLHARGASPPSALESAEATLARARASLAGARANDRLARARVVQARTDLSRAVITSPVDGVVLTRSVEPGNTVAASLQAPELFLIAEDLRKMKLQVAIQEADVGLVKAGHKATFLVDAWPERTFEAEVKLVHVYPTVTNNVVTYTAELSVDNADELLRPGMTAVTTIMSDPRKDVLRVPNTALRFSPRREQQSASFSLFPTRRRGGRRGSSNANAGGSTVYILRERNGVQRPRRVPVRTGRSDGTYTEILSGKLEAGARVITEQREAQAEGQRNAGGTTRGGATNGTRGAAGSTRGRRGQ